MMMNRPYLIKEHKRVFKVDPMRKKEEKPNETTLNVHAKKQREKLRIKES